MIDDMGIFRTTVGIAALATPERRRELFDVTTRQITADGVQDWSQ
jgi:hypothetical protein